MKTLVLIFVFSGLLAGEFREIAQSFTGEPCQSCDGSLEKAFGRLKGVSAVKVDSQRGLVQLTLAEGNGVKLSDLRDRIKGAGYKPGDAQVVVTVRITGSDANVDPSGEVFRVAAPIAREGPPRKKASIEVEGAIDVPPSPHVKPQLRVSKTR